MKKSKLDTNKYVIQEIYSEKQSVKITRNIITKLMAEALQVNKIPLLIIGLTNANETLRLEIMMKKEKK
jgi:hypothetical protein